MPRPSAGLVLVVERTLRRQPRRGRRRMDHSRRSLRMTRMDLVANELPRGADRFGAA